MPVKKNESARRLLLCINGTLQKKAKDVVALNVKEISSFTDYLLICSGATDRQVQAISVAIQQYLKKEGIRPLGVEGEANGQWILLDYSDLVVHIQSKELRQYYMLDHLWNDCPRLDLRLDLTR